MTGFRLPTLVLGLLSALVFAGAAQAADGAALYEQACAKCHSLGPGAFFTHAPKIGAKDWDARLAAAGSVDALLASVENGKGKMPPQLGLPRSKAEPDSRLDESDLRAAVEFLLSRAPHS
jgi:cytochrome c5